MEFAWRPDTDIDSRDPIATGDTKGAWQDDPEHRCVAHLLEVTADVEPRTPRYSAGWRRVFRLGLRVSTEAITGELCYGVLAVRLSIQRLPRWFARALRLLRRCPTFETCMPSSTAFSPTNRPTRTIPPAYDGGQQPDMQAARDWGPKTCVVVGVEEYYCMSEPRTESRERGRKPRRVAIGRSITPQSGLGVVTVPIIKLSSTVLFCWL